MDSSVREIGKNDIALIVDYFLKSDPEYLHGRGVDINKLPGKKEWNQIILEELEKPVESKNLYYLIWQIDDVPVGHSHINDIVFGKEAYMHLHLWQSDDRKKGNGSYFVKESLPYYFDNFKLKRLFLPTLCFKPGA